HTCANSNLTARAKQKGTSDTSAGRVNGSADCCIRGKEFTCCSHTERGTSKRRMPQLDARRGSLEDGVARTALEVTSSRHLTRTRHNSERLSTCRIISSD